MSAIQTSYIKELEEELRLFKSRLLSSETKLIESEKKLSRAQEELLEKDKLIGWFQRQFFGVKSERAVADVPKSQLLLEGFEAAQNEEPEYSEIRAHKKKKKRKSTQKETIKVPEDTPVKTTIYDLREEEKVCPKIGKPLVKIGEEISSKLVYEPSSFHIERIVRIKYALPKESEEETILCADLPESLLSNCRAHDTLLAHIIVQKYGNHLPLYRVKETLAREGIHISRQTLSNWIKRAGFALKPLYLVMKEKVLVSKNIFVDETSIPIQKKGHGKVKKYYMWVVSGGLSRDPPYRFYQFCNGRQHFHAENLLRDYSGVLHTDKYAAYEKIAQKASSLVWCPCWAHVRRKIFEASDADQEDKAFLLQKIRYLFLLERVAWSRSPEERLRIREKKEKPIIKKIFSFALEKLGDPMLLPKSSFGKALKYMMGMSSYLTNYLSHPYARMDNNVAERAVRPLAIGRKNWLFVGSEDSGEAAAILFSLVQTCRALSINPYKYLVDIMKRLPSYPSQKVHELLPDYWLKSQNEKIYDPKLRTLSQF